jgi:phosphoglycerate dehydrogenase-like enzyme
VRVLLVRAPSVAPFLDEIVAALTARGGEVHVTDMAGVRSLAEDVWDVLAGPGAMPCDAAFFGRFHRLKAVVAYGSGVEGIDRAAASAAGVAIGHGGTRENVEGMASATVMLMLALLHDLKGTEQRMRDGAPAPPAPRGRGLTGLNVGLIGYGRIGREVARLLAPWRVTLAVYAPRLAAGEGVASLGLDELLRGSDVVSLHANLNDETRLMLDAERLALMKPGAVLINVARGGMVDEAAVARMAHEGRLAGAAFDVFETEPLAADSPLRSAPNIILTPHAVGHTAEGARSVVDALVSNIAAVLDGRLPPLLRNPEVADRTAAASSGEGTDAPSAAGHLH